MHRSQLSLYWLEQIRREIAPFVHFLRVIPSKAKNLADNWITLKSLCITSFVGRGPSLPLRM